MTQEAVEGDDRVGTFILHNRWYSRPASQVKALSCLFIKILNVCNISTSDGQFIQFSTTDDKRLEIWRGRYYDEAVVPAGVRPRWSLITQTAAV